jgi:hypothetical protein
MYAQVRAMEQFPPVVTVTSGGTERLGTLWLDRSFGEWVMGNGCRPANHQENCHSGSTTSSTARVIGGLLSRVSGTAYSSQ